MEPSGRNQWHRSQIAQLRKRLRYADPQWVATHDNARGPDGKEGVDGSSPSEGLEKPL
jgi:hypothetical protein